MSRIPNHKLALKVGVTVMCLRNIDQRGGLCNGTRLQILRMGINNIEAKIISRGKVGYVCSIPRMNISMSDKKMPFQLNRRQFPVSVCFAMTINKSQVTIIEAKTVDGACYLELKVPSRSRRVGCWDFLDKYGHHYGDGISRPLLPSEDDAQVTIIEAKTVDGACYLELKVPSRSRRVGCWDFLDRYGHHYGDGISRLLLPSELSGADNSEKIPIDSRCLLWHQLHVFDAYLIKEFVESILSIGDGKIGGKNDGHSEVEFPKDMLIPDSDDNVETIIKETYENWQQQLWDLTYFQDRAILAPTHEEVDKVNARMIQIAWMSRIPNHKLALKVGATVMCLRNIDQRGGLCNGTRLQILRMGINNIEAKIISGGKVGDVCSIPRMNISPSDKKMPFQLNRRQFPDDAQVTVNEAKTVDGACYLELKVPSRSRRVGCWDFLDRYGHHYGDGISPPLLPSELTGADNSEKNPYRLQMPLMASTSCLRIGDGKIGGKNDGHAEVEFLEDMLYLFLDDIVGNYYKGKLM
ncbi:ATP-dependent DNA helicase PIF1-like protein [Tanacetum coccineum]